MNDEKVIDRIILYFEEALRESQRFIILLANSESEIKYVKSKNKNNVYFLKYNTKDFWAKVGDVKQYSNIIIHNLCDTKVKFINSINHKSISWIMWGADLYNLLLQHRGYILYKNDGFEDILNSKKTLKILLKPIIKIKKNILIKQRIEAIKKVSLFLGNNIEYNILLSYYPEFSHLQKKEFFFYPIDDVIQNINPCYENKNNLIIGNSASPTGNHVYVINKIKNILPKDINVIVPLNYGNTKYKNYILTIGNNILGNKFKPLEDFLPLDQYNKLLSTSNIFIYGNLRQEAFGNIIIALYLGGKVFLDKANPLYNLLTTLGVKVFNIESIESNDIINNLETNIIAKNREILLKTYNKDNLIKLIKTTYEN